MEDLVLIGHRTLSLSLFLVLTVVVSCDEEIMRLGTLLLHRWIFNGILEEQTKPGRVSFIPYRFEKIDPKLETRVSGEVGVDPPHYVGVA